MSLRVKCARKHVILDEKVCTSGRVSIISEDIADENFSILEHISLESSSVFTHRVLKNET